MKQIVCRLILAFWIVYGAGVSLAPRALANPQGSGPVPSGSPLPQVLPSLRPYQTRQLLKEFTQALKTELQALDHRQKFEMKELKASQGARVKEWQKKENEARRKFFAEHTTGPERRSYVRDLRERHESLMSMLKTEEKQRAQSNQVHMLALKSDQAARLKEFQECLKRGEVPPNRLWPQPGH